MRGSRPRDDKELAMKKTKKPHLSIVIPAYNEEENFKAGVLDKVYQYLTKQDFPWEVIVVDDGSLDKTADLVEGFVKSHNGFRLFRNPHHGKAFTVATGVKKSAGRFIYLADFDLAAPLVEIEKMWPKIKNGASIVIGSREGLGAKRVGEPFYRHLMGRIFNLLVQLLVLPGIEDTQCGFKLFKADVAKNLFSRLWVYKKQEVRDAFTGAWDVELLLLAKKFGHKIAQVPIFWQAKPTLNVNPVKDSIRMLRDIILIRWNDLKGEYDK